MKTKPIGRGKKIKLDNCEVPLGVPVIFRAEKEGTITRVGYKIVVKPTPEPEECTPHNVYTDLEEKKTWCVRCGKDFSKPKSKVPEAIEQELWIDVWIEDKLEQLRDKQSEILSYLKEKEDL